ncbi:MAG: NAD(P)-dependent alcohol dehydrogenase [Candidatus Kariarchaeaceae archaeon]|jgi:NADPH:quinone reductase-like Zn-dependent oxidoreductase
MKAIICPKYGPPDVLQLIEVKKPIPKDNEVLIKIYAATVTAADSEMRGFKMRSWISPLMRLAFGFRGPRKKILGQELAGEIESVGKDVKLFREGDQVFGFTSIELGTHAEYKCLREDGLLAIKPTNMTYEEAAAIPFGGLLALEYLRKADIQVGQKVLINGAGGTIGTSAVQLAKYFGAEVTGVDTTGKLEMLRSIGADHVIDYTREDFTQRDEMYDVIFDVVGETSFSASIRSLKQHGHYLLANPRLLPMIRGKWTSMRSDKTVITWIAGENKEDLLFIKELAETGKITSVIDRRYPLEQTVEAHRYVETGGKLGQVVITLDHL